MWTVRADIMPVGQLKKSRRLGSQVYSTERPHLDLPEIDLFADDDDSPVGICRCPPVVFDTSDPDDS
jgi:hypothetical protein